MSRPTGAFVDHASRSSNTIQNARKLLLETCDEQIKFVDDNQSKPGNKNATFSVTASGCKAQIKFYNKPLIIPGRTDSVFEAPALVDVRKFYETALAAAIAGEFDDQIAEILNKKREAAKRSYARRKGMIPQSRYTRHDTVEYGKYRKQVDNITYKSMRKFDKLIDPDRLRGRDYHIDHMYSAYEGFNNGVSPEIIGHHSNLCLIPSAANLMKNTACSITLDELLQRYVKSKFSESHSVDI